MRFGSRRLSETEGARAGARLLLAHALRRPREWIVGHPEERVSGRQRATFERLCERRRAGEPIAYIIGSAGFYGREFFVNGDVLIPRPETEHLVDEAIAFIRSLGVAVTVLDVGAGSGAIACSIAAETDAVVIGTDISEGAIAVARQNARRLNVADRCRFLQGDLAEPVRGRRFGAIVANLPYVPEKDVPTAPDPLSFEPRVALEGGSDGLKTYGRLVPELPSLLGPDGLLLLEAAPPTIGRLAAMVQAVFPRCAVEIKRDYGGLPRYLKARQRNSQG